MSPSTIRKLKTFALWVFLAPLIVVLGTADVVTRKRSRHWPFRR
jgi:hypothetical protein